ncbi:MAG: methionine--tRNA ligase [Kiloniellales bacterium]|nr:methionine--tRNA ligase [Kiloniellales bacterium]MDJ0983792.1 methionine--tRNA ligase [Kiloniellales bacterium]
MSAADKTPYYITTAISYVNGAPHLGHAYEAIATDVMARFKRLDGYDVHFLTGTDEHGQKVEQFAGAAGKEPKAFCDEIAGLFRAMGGYLNISNDDFIRTTEARHVTSSQAIWQKLEAAGDIYLGKYAGWYSVRDEAFFGEDELTKDGDGKFLAPSGAPVDWVEEPTYFFRLSAYADKLLAHYATNPDFILPHYRRNEVENFIKQGLLDLSISRTTFSWGIPVPGDADHIMYVWLDALTNYITGVGYPDEESETFKTYWPADLHVIGKDILRFHTIYWPAFLMSAGLPLPKRVFAHGFLNVEGQKMSKSLGNVLSPEAIVEEFGLDQLRYYLLREVPFGNDGSISRESLIRRSNSDLANDFGNLGQRVLSMIAKNCDGRVPAPGAFTEADRALLDQAAGLLERLRAHYEVQAFHKSLEATWEIVGAANRYVDEQAPWALRKTDPERMATVLYVVAEVVRHLAILTQPVMPESMARMLDQLGVVETSRGATALSTALASGTELPKPAGVFPRFVEEEEAAS